MLDTVFVPINRAGWPFIGAFAAATLVLWLVAEPLGVVGLILTLWCVYFFRDPERFTPVRAGLVISPADGVVQLIDTAAPPPELDLGAEPMTRICVFMNVFNVHVNRAPADGTISRLAYRPGKFLNASLDKASDLNERMAYAMTTTDGDEIAFVQIAGLVARRIVSQVKEGDALSAGQRFGLIRFGSRVDVYLPARSQALVGVGQTALAGETVLADLSGTEPRRQVEIH